MHKDPDSETRRGGYDPSYFGELAKAEDLHFWFVCRNDLIRCVAADLCRGFAPGALILEAGCGTGNVLRHLATACPQASLVVGMDMWREGLSYARGRTSCPLVAGDISAPPFSQPFDMICLFDVLEHIDDDRTTLRQVYSLLSPGGILLLTVPAHPSLWSYFDEAARHCRRYKRTELREKLRGAGFTVEFLSAFMMSLFPLVWTARRIASITARNRGTPFPGRELALREFRIVPGVNRVISWLLRLENQWIARGHTLPVGTSLLAIGHKPGRERAEDA